MVVAGCGCWLRVFAVAASAASATLGASSGTLALSTSSKPLRSSAAIGSIGSGCDGQLPKLQWENGRPDWITHTPWHIYQHLWPKCRQRYTRVSGLWMVMRPELVDKQKRTKFLMSHALHYLFSKIVHQQVPYLSRLLTTIDKYRQLYSSVAVVYQCLPWVKWAPQVPKKNGFELPKYGLKLYP